MSISKDLVFVIWCIVSILLGISLAYQMLKAKKHCDNNWVFMNPFWVFMTDSFDVEGKNICKKGQKILIVLMIIFIPGAIYFTS